MRGFGWAMLAIWIGALAGCAAAKMAPVAREAAPAPEAAVQYERILGVFALDPHAIVFLNPAVCERYCDDSLGVDGLQIVAAQFAARGMRRGEAAARLNSGAVLWQAGEGDAAYDNLMAAHQLFAEQGDVEGLAHTYEWLGYLFREASQTAKAEEHLSVAYRMFELLGNRAAAQRILAYAD